MATRGPTVTRDEGREELLEALAALEHEQWMEWSQNIAASESISAARRDRWEDYWVPYDELDEEVKDHDRKWARKVLAVLDDEGQP